MELVVGADNFLVAIISDGAGSAKFSSVGSRLAVECFARCAISYLRGRQSLDSITRDLMRDWMDEIRNRIFHSAELRATEPQADGRNSDRSARLLQSGDRLSRWRWGVCPAEEGKQLWEVPSWPAHGEYATSTYFVTDDPEPRLQFNSIDGEFSELAMFSDGIERLALDFMNKSASDRFFDPMFAPLAKLGPGRDRGLSVSLRQYLDSPRILERTDDDKSLLLARRVFVQ